MSGDKDRASPQAARRASRKKRDIEQWMLDELKSFRELPDGIDAPEVMGRADRKGNE